MLLEKIKLRVNDEKDFVNIKFGTINARIGYRIGFAVDQYMRQAAKQAAQYDNAPASFWRAVEVSDLEDVPKPNRFPQQSTLVPTVSTWEVRINPPLVGLFFDGTGQEMDYETAIRLGHEIRRASRRAKAWAGDTSKYSKLLGNLTAS